MKKIALSIIIFISLISCKEQILNGPLIFTGKIIKPSFDSVSILDPLNRVISLKKLTKDNAFMDTISVSPGIYYLCYNFQKYSTYLKPSYNLYVEFDPRIPEESLIFKGYGSNENNFLIKKQLFEKSLPNYNDFSMDEENFLKTNEALYNSKIKFLKSYKNSLEKDFVEWELKNLKIEKLLRISRFERMHQLAVNDKNFKVSSQFPDPYSSMDFNDDLLVLSPDYLMLIDNYLVSKINALFEINDSMDWSLEVLDIVDNKIKSLKVKEYVCFPYLDELMLNTKELDTVYNRLISHTEDKEIIRVLKVKYESYKKMQKGINSPNFSFYDINDQLVTLASLKGKVVFIDIWATWCSPCMAEIPALKQLEEDLKNYNIQFVSISNDRDEGFWRKTVKEKKLPGIQICVNSDTCSFFKDFSVTGIPRFIILDKNGIIVDPNAMRPSNPMLKKKLLYLLK